MAKIALDLRQDIEEMLFRFDPPYQQEEQLEDRRYHGNIYNIVVKSENIKSIG